MKTPAPLRIGVLGLTHDHVWSNLRELARVKGAALVAAADPNPPLLDQVRRQFNCHIYPAYDEMLQREDLDAVYVFSDNATGVELTQMAAARRLHVLIEKPLAATLPGADRILAVCLVAATRTRHRPGAEGRPGARLAGQIPRRPRRPPRDGLLEVFLRMALQFQPQRRRRPD
jgi:predicted dehydrogenase